MKTALRSWRVLPNKTAIDDKNVNNNKMLFSWLNHEKHEHISTIHPVFFQHTFFPVWCVSQELVETKLKEKSEYLTSIRQVKNKNLNPHQQQRRWSVSVASQLVSAASRRHRDHPSPQDLSVPAVTTVFCRPLNVKHCVWYCVYVPV